MGFVKEGWRRCLVREVCLDALLRPRFFLAGNEPKYSLRNWSIKEGGREGAKFRISEERWGGGKVGRGSRRK